MREITSKEELVQYIALSKNEPVLFYKHSNRCPICTSALEEVKKFTQKHPEILCYYIDVISARDISLNLAEQSAITHESPQAIFYHQGKPVWNASHRRITFDALEKQYSQF